VRPPVASSDAAINRRNAPSELDTRSPSQRAVSSGNAPASSIMINSPDFCSSKWLLKARRARAGSFADGEPSSCSTHAPSSRGGSPAYGR
jgi:hypothetical protein